MSSPDGDRIERHQALKQALELHKRSRQQFSRAHEQGLAALERRDLRALSQAIDAETSAIAAHVAAIHQLNDAIKTSKAKRK
ncbi:MAG TPA: hypothetical protein VL882_10330 [Vicinamibacterales bacterium]|jgi:hypothetical protein|nr:hypothetical protein [Vicinamibacterales bacterium]